MLDDWVSTVFAVPCTGPSGLNTETRSIRVSDPQSFHADSDPGFEIFAHQDLDPGLDFSPPKIVPFKYKKSKKR
jgi:hypothetical protein